MCETFLTRPTKIVSISLDRVEISECINDKCAKHILRYPVFFRVS